MYVTPLGFPVTIKGDAVPTHEFDFENNPYHKFWAGPGMRVKMWALTDKPNGVTYMSHPADLRVATFLDFVEENNLGTVWRAQKEGLPIFGAWLTPNFDKIKAELPAVIKEANDMCNERYNIIKSHSKGITAIKDKVAKLW